TSSAVAIRPMMSRLTRRMNSSSEVRSAGVSFWSFHWLAKYSLMNWVVGSTFACWPRLASTVTAKKMAKPIRDKLLRRVDAFMGQISEEVDDKAAVVYAIAGGLQAPVRGERDCRSACAGEPGLPD